LNQVFKSVVLRQAVGRRVLVATLAVLVCVLALQAKLSLYDPPHPGSISPAAASKLWVSGEKLKGAVPGLLPLLWLAAALFFLPPPRPVRRAEPGTALPPRHCCLRELYRFLRPPPAF
jgi:hypothetical protein